MPFSAFILGGLGLLPFVGLPILHLTGFISLYEAGSYFSQYSAVILSFFGGVHWWIAVNKPTQSAQLYVAMLPSIIAWLSLVLLPEKLTLMVLAGSFLGIFLYDFLTLKGPPLYMRLRAFLTGIVVGCHAFTWWLY